MKLFAHALRRLAYRLDPQRPDILYAEAARLHGGRP